MSARLNARLQGQLSVIQHANRLRTLNPQPAPAQRRLLNFSSNDYLGLSQHPLLIARAHAWSKTWGAGATASRLVCGDLALHQQVESKLADLKGSETALLFNSGFQANAGILAALLQPLSTEPHPPLVLADKLIHASMYQGIRAAGAELQRFRHNDLDHLRQLLERSQQVDRWTLVLTESVFSMDGDLAPLSEIAALTQTYGATLYVDEAHATGVFGHQGAGLANTETCDLVMGTFSKALGGFGAYLCCSHTVRDYLINACPAFIYATALPPSVLGAMDAALDVIPTMDAERARLQQLSAQLRQRCDELALDYGDSASQIVPVVTGDAEHTLSLAARLRERGVLAVAIRPPTVPTGKSRIRFTLSAAHTDDDFAQLCELLPELRST